MARASKAVAALIKDKGGIQLDIGCGRTPERGFVGMDIQPFPDVDIVHDWNQIPYPLPNESVIRILARHVIEHVPPHNFGFINFMNELWRVLKPDGQLAIVMPYATSPGMYQDPTHCNFCNENTWLYFDPLEDKAGGTLYKFYQPKPWRVVHITFDPVANMEVLLEKRREDKSYYE
jgi:SAM-dependent methyltransferase